jgi:hypothetical protein
MEAAFSFGQRIDLEKAAHDSGFEMVVYGPGGDIARLASADAGLRPMVRVEANRWFVTFSDRAVARSLADEARFADREGDCFRIDGTGDLTALLSRAWRLSRALPTAPLQRFEAATAGPEDPGFHTEVERMVRQRRGQDIFRDALMNYWDGRCAVTCVDQLELLRASHMKPWADCANDAERMDPFNGLLLTADWDAAFDNGLVTFDAEGRAMFSPALKASARARLMEGRIREDRPLEPAHGRYLDWHRNVLFVS